MLRFIVFGFSVVLGLSGPALGQVPAAGEVLWGPVRAGMSVEELQRALPHTLPTAEPPPPPHSPTPGVWRVSNGAYLVADMPVFAFFYFDDRGGLSAVRIAPITHPGIRADEGRAAFDTLRKAVVSWGLGTETCTGAPVTDCRWPGAASTGRSAVLTRRPANRELPIELLITPSRG